MLACHSVSLNVNLKLGLNVARSEPQPKNCGYQLLPLKKFQQ